MKKIFRKIISIYAQVGTFLSRVSASFWNSNMVIALSTLPFYFVCKLSKASSAVIAAYLITMTFIKCGFFILYSLEKIMETYTKDKSFNWFLWQFTNIFFLLILSFGIDNLLLFDVNKTNFTAVKNDSLFGLVFDFCHYSFMTFTTVGFGEITAATRIAKFYSALEVFIGFVFVGYILAGFSSIRDAMLKDKPLNIDYEIAKQDKAENQ